MKRRLRSERLLVVTMIMWLLGACKPTVPSRFIQPDDMEALLYDYHLGQALAYLNRDDSARAFDEARYFEATLEKHGVTHADYDSSMIYYFTRADRFDEIYQRIAKRLGDDALKLGAAEGEVNRYSQLNATGDTANVWEGNSAVVLMPYAPYNRVSFTQKADTTYKKGDIFMLLFAADFCYQSGSREAVACLTVTYDNDSVVNKVNHVTTSGLMQLRAPVVEGRTAKELKGYIYLGPGNEKSSTLKMMYIHDLQLIRFHQASNDTAKAERKPITMTTDTLRRDTVGKP